MATVIASAMSWSRSSCQRGPISCTAKGTPLLSVSAGDHHHGAVADLRGHQGGHGLCLRAVACGFAVGRPGAYRRRRGEEQAATMAANA